MKSHNQKRLMLLATAAMLCSASAVFADPIVVTTQTENAKPVEAVANAVNKGVAASVKAVKKTTNAVKEALTPDEHKVTVVEHSRHGYLNGHKGYRYARPHYIKYVDGWYYPEEAYNSKPNVASATSEVQTTVTTHEKLPRAHIAYCVSHFRSYRMSDNSFQPFSGQRQQCYSRFYRG